MLFQVGVAVEEVGGPRRTVLPRLPGPEGNLVRRIPKPLRQRLLQLGQGEILPHAIRFLCHDLLKIHQFMALQQKHFCISDWTSSSKLPNSGYLVEYHLVFGDHPKVQVVGLLALLLSSSCLRVPVNGVN